MVISKEYFFPLEMAAVSRVIKLFTTKWRDVRTSVNIKILSSGANNISQGHSTTLIEGN
jgi:hypothetical protein